MNKLKETKIIDIENCQLNKLFELIDRILCKSLNACNNKQKFILTKISQTKLKNSLKILKQNIGLPKLKKLEIESYIIIATNLLKKYS